MLRNFTNESYTGTVTPKDEATFMSDTLDLEAQITVIDDANTEMAGVELSIDSAIGSADLDDQALAAGNVTAATAALAVASLHMLKLTPIGVVMGDQEASFTQESISGNPTQAIKMAADDKRSYANIAREGIVRMWKALSAMIKKGILKIQSLIGRYESKATTLVKELKELNDYNPKVGKINDVDTVSIINDKFQAVAVMGDNTEIDTNVILDGIAIQTTTNIYDNIETILNGDPKNMWDLAKTTLIDSTGASIIKDEDKFEFKGGVTKALIDKNLAAVIPVIFSGKKIEALWIFSRTGDEPGRLTFSSTSMTLDKDLDVKVPTIKQLREIAALILSNSKRMDKEVKSFFKQSEDAGKAFAKLSKTISSDNREKNDKLTFANQAYKASAQVSFAQSKAAYRGLTYGMGAVSAFLEYAEKNKK